jgi:hypothetical protein
MLSVVGAPSLPSCRVCGWAALPGSSLCLGCLDIREWSRVNRAFCDLVHRARPAAPDDVEAPDALALTA